MDTIHQNEMPMPAFFDVQPIITQLFENKKKKVIFLEEKLL